MRKHSIRFPDPEWDAAMAAADRRGENLAEKIRDFVREYGSSDQASEAGEGRK